jgi:hypothetical protein
MRPVTISRSVGQQAIIATGVVAGDIVVIDGQVRDMKMLRGPKGERLIVVARNNDKVMVLRQTTRR